MSAVLAVLLLGAAFWLAVYRLCTIIPYFHQSAPPATRGNHVLFVLGSGGHTAEMLMLVSSLAPGHSSPMKRTYVFSTGDSLSASKAAAFDSSANLLQIPRARRVGQSWISTPLSCVICFLRCVWVFAEARPDVVVCNGPGSAVMMVAVVLVFKFLGLSQTRTIYVESFARVSSLSLSGKLLYPLVNRFVVQWPGLKAKYARAEYHGVLV